VTFAATATQTRVPTCATQTSSRGRIRSSSAATAAVPMVSLAKRRLVRSWLGINASASIVTEIRLEW
jgi:hypothetical protein